jgi:EAL domain-containing protein (putative c-di-GMP-specific phosphodiesterase class I)
LLWRVVERIGEPLFVAGHELRLSASAGIAHRDSTTTAESLMRNAGLALHEAKTRGGGRVELFEGAMRERVLARLELEANLRHAIARDELWLALQPIVTLPDARPVRAEALLRWHHESTDIGPDRFIPLAEETGLIVPIGDWTIQQAAKLVTSAPAGRLMVNLSPRQLASPDLPQRIARVIQSQGVPPGALGFEVTETLLIEHFDYTAQVLCRIRQLGCAVGLDDFGTGYSSLGYLRKLPIDFVKIDGSLTADVDTDRQAKAIVSAIVTMADALHLDVIAEGIETQAQADALTTLGCRHAQGYLFGRPARPA